MKTEIPADYFEKTSHRSMTEIRMAAARFEQSERCKYDIRSNGRHIWVEPSRNRHEFWSPLLHLELKADRENHTFIKGRFRKNPLQWILFAILRLASVTVFICCGLIAYLKWSKGDNFDAPLFGVLMIIGLWLAMYFVSQWNRKKGTTQISELRNFTEQLVGS